MNDSGMTAISRLVREGGIPVRWSADESRYVINWLEWTRRRLLDAPDRQPADTNDWRTDDGALQSLLDSNRRPLGLLARHWQQELEAWLDGIAVGSAGRPADSGPDMVQQGLEIVRQGLALVKAGTVLLSGTPAAALPVSYETMCLELRLAAKAFDNVRPRREGLVLPSSRARVEEGGTLVSDRLASLLEGQPEEE